MSVVGGNGDDFWSLTLRQIKNVLDGHADRLSREQQSLAWAVWHTAYFTAYAPKKARDFPRLEKLFSRKSEKAESKSSWKDDFAAAQAWVQSRGKR